jgi:hypothetical protein
MILGLVGVLAALPFVGQDRKLAYAAEAPAANRYKGELQLEELTFKLPTGGEVKVPAIPVYQFNFPIATGADPQEYKITQTYHAQGYQFDVTVTIKPDVLKALGSGAPSEIKHTTIFINQSGPPQNLMLNGKKLVDDTALIIVHGGIHIHF